MNLNPGRIDRTLYNADDSASIKSLTDVELLALNYPTNLADAHTHQKPSSSAWDHVHGRLSNLFREATSLKQSETDDAAFRAYLSIIGQRHAVDDGWYINTYAASISIDIVAHCLARRHRCGALLEPTFDNIPALLQKHSLALQPIRLALSQSCRLMAEQIVSEINRHYRAPEFVFLVLPNNPTGHYIPRVELSKLCNFAVQHNLTLVIDACFRLYDRRAQFDWYEVLAQSKASFIVIEDTGKIWPTADVKVSYITASPDWRDDLQEARNDLLLNVSPLANLIVREYAAYHLKHPYELTRQTTRARTLVRKALATMAPLRTASADSRIGVELIESHPFDSYVLVQEAAKNGLAILSGHQFYWSNPDRGKHKIRLALARDHNEITRGMALLRQALRNI